jgi:hypothetical protein
LRKALMNTLAGTATMARVRRVDVAAASLARPPTRAYIRR